MNPYYDDGTVTIYHGDCREITPALAADLVVSDPPYPNAAGHFLAGIETAEWFCRTFAASRWFVFWHQLHSPPVSLPLVAHHVWHKTNTNRPDNYEPIYEFADETERPSRVFPHPVVYLGLTGCKEATGHPTQKPVDLVKQLLLLRKDQGVVLDPFMGSGTTLRAAKDLGRKAIGVELDERYCEIAARRMGQEVLDFGAVS